MKDDESLAQFIETLCTTCRACANLISLVHETEECKKCANSRKRQLTQSATPPSSPVLADKRNRQSNSATTSPSEKNVKQEVGVKSPVESKSKNSTNNGKEPASQQNSNHSLNNNNNSASKSSNKVVIKSEPNGANAQTSSTTQALRKVRFQHHANANTNSSATNGNQETSQTTHVSTSHCSSSSTSSSTSLAGGSANTSTIGKYLAPLVAEVHPEQANVKPSNSYYKSPTTLSSSASLPTSVSTPFTGCHSASSTALAAGGVTAAKAATAPAGAAATAGASPSYTAITSPVSTPTSALANSHLRSQPIDWTIEEVIQYIESNDNSLAVHGDLFRKHEIDGKALLLLNSEMMMKYMGLKLGPALKICNLVNKVNGRRNNLAL
ncbi:GD20776 [Drosophila simulans]|uniref:GD20776 n=2 Tax=Drosophila simulans TaxID=7240 RepID=B4QWI7_DROSI|nr:GD20776 [Drosophila simulans]